jgi:hypothetical protein
MADPNYAGCSESNHSRRGFGFLIGKRLETKIGASVTKAELDSLVEATNHVSGLKRPGF